MAARRRREKASGLVSSAGLMRYFESEETAFKVSPKSVVFITLLIGVLALALNIIYGRFPF